MTGTILPGITRDGVLTLLRDWGVKATERRITLKNCWRQRKTASCARPWHWYCSGHFPDWRVQTAVSGIKLAMAASDGSQKIYTSLTDISGAVPRINTAWTVEVK